MYDRRYKVALVGYCKCPLEWLAKKNWPKYKTLFRNYICNTGILIFLDIKVGQEVYTMSYSLYSIYIFIKYTYIHPIDSS